MKFLKSIVCKLFKKKKEKEANDKKFRELYEEFKFNHQKARDLVKTAQDMLAEADKQSLVGSELRKVLNLVEQLQIEANDAADKAEIALKEKHRMAKHIYG